MESNDSKFANFTLSTLKAFLEARSHNVFWQWAAVTCCSCYKMPPNTFFLRTRDLLVSQKTTQRHLSSTLHPLSTVMFATATVVAFIPFRDSRFNFHCYTQREATPTQKSARKCAATSRDFLRETSQSAFTLANQLRWIAQYAILILTNRTQLCHATDLPSSHAQLKGGGGEKGKEAFLHCCHPCSLGTINTIILGGPQSGLTGNWC